MSYEKEFQIFSSAINQAARSFYYHQEIQKQIYEDGKQHEDMPNGYFQDSKMFQAVQLNSQFWMDYKHSSIVFAIITLGKILDKGSKTHKIERLINTAEKSNLFTKEKLRERKIKKSENSHDWIDNYMQNTHELSDDNFKSILDFASEVRKEWEKVKDLRNKIYAHQEVMEEQKKSSILEQSKYSVFEEIITRLLTIEHVFWEAFHNGKEPDLNYKNTRVHESVKEDVRSLLLKISQ